MDWIGTATVSPAKASIKGGKLIRMNVMSFCSPQRVEFVSKSAIDAFAR